MGKHRKNKTFTSIYTPTERKKASYIIAIALGVFIGLVLKMVIEQPSHKDWEDHATYCWGTGRGVAYTGFDLWYIHSHPDEAYELVPNLTSSVLMGEVCCYRNITGYIKTECEVPYSQGGTI